MVKNHAAFRTFVMWYLCEPQKGPTTPNLSIAWMDVQLPVHHKSCLKKHTCLLTIDVATCLNDLVAVGGSSGTSSSRSLTVSDILLPALELKVLLIIVVDVKTKGGRVDVAVTPDEQGTENGLGQDIKNAVESGLRVG